MTQKLKKMTTSIIFHTLGFLCYVETNVSEEAKNTNQIWSSNRLRDFRWMPKDKIQIRLFCPFLLSLRVIKYSLLHVNLHFKESGTDFLNFLVNTFLCFSIVYAGADTGQMYRVELSRQIYDIDHFFFCLLKCITPVPRADCKLHKQGA